MNDVLKQRLVGALILVALGVVFWPIIFVEPGEQNGAAQGSIPPRPQVRSTPVAAPDIAGLRPSPEISREPEPADSEDVGEDARAALASAGEPAAVEPDAGAPPVSLPVVGKTRSEAPVTPALDAEGLPVAWILRIASLSSADKADALRRALLDMGHKAYVKKISSGGKTLYRVYVGPKGEKARLQMIQKSVDRRFGVNSLITRYYP